MKRLIQYSLLACFLLAACSIQAVAGSGSDSQQRVIPVLVNVNAKGEVTRIAPAVQLRPAMSKALQQTVRGMIHKPAMKQGKPVSSQFVLNLAIAADAEADNEYRFSYVSSQAVPAGSWHWIEQGGDQGVKRYALQSNAGAGININIPRDTYATTAAPPTPRPRSPNNSGQ